MLRSWYNKIFQQPSRSKIAWSVYTDTKTTIIYPVTGCFQKPSIRDVVFTNSARTVIFRSYMSLSIVHVFTTVGKKRKSVSWPVSWNVSVLSSIQIIEHNYSIITQSVTSGLSGFGKTRPRFLSGSETKLWIVLLVKFDFDSEKW